MGKYKQIDPTEKWRLYNLGFSMKEMARELNCTQENILYWIKINGLKAHKKPNEVRARGSRCWECRHVCGNCKIKKTPENVEKCQKFDEGINKLKWIDDFAAKAILYWIFGEEFRVASRRKGA